jgi:hypothetical protein
MHKRSGDAEEFSPKHRYNREELMAVLDDLREDVENGETFHREFSPHLPNDSDLAPGLPELFRRSGLDPAAPGHWQLLLLTISNAIHPNWDGPKVKWVVWKEPFMNRIAELHQDNPDSKRFDLCEMFKSERRSDAHWPSAETLRLKVQDFLGVARDLRDKNQASENELRWLITLGDEE